MLMLQLVLVQEPISTSCAPFRCRPDRYNGLLGALNSFAGVHVYTKRAALADAARQFEMAYLMLSSTRHPEEALQQCDDGARVATRLIGLDLPYPRMGGLLESLSMVAGIDPYSLNTWANSYWEGERSEVGFYGLCRVGAAIGARCCPDPSPRYCLLESPLHEGGLPHLLVDYLRAHAEGMTRTDPAIS